MVIVGSSTLSYFYPTLVKGLGYTAHMAQYMVVPIYAVAFVAVACTGYVMDKIPQYRGLVIAGWLAVSLVCSVCVCAIYNFTARYVLLVFMAAGLWASNGLALSYAASTFGSMPQEVRGVSLALVNALGNLAQIYGAYLFPSDDAPKVRATPFLFVSTYANVSAVSSRIRCHQWHVRIWCLRLHRRSFPLQAIPSKDQHCPCHYPLSTIGCSRKRRRLRYQATKSTCK
jgi:MFS family permease